MPWTFGTGRFSAATLAGDTDDVGGGVDPADGDDQSLSRGSVADAQHELVERHAAKSTSRSAPR